MSFIPYLYFPGTCEEALDFYAEVLGGAVEGVWCYSQLPPEAGEVPKGKENQIMNATLRVGEARLMASDNMTDPFEPSRGTHVYFGFDDVERARRVFNRLAKDGDVRMPFEPTFWTKGFGMCRDRFGTDWMIAVHAEGESV
jgi:PhnB protein